MEHMKKKKSYAHVFSVMVICSWVAVSVSAEPESPAKDDYQVFIQKGSDSTPDFFYAFHKTNITGGTVYSEGPSDLYQELQDKRKEVSLDTFPALKRSASLSDRATKFTRLFVSKNATALLATLTNQADAQQKKLVVSAKVPQKVGGYCTGSLTFFVTQKDDTLSIKVSDQRKCMRSGSGEARLARTAELERKRQQAKEAREAREAQDFINNLKKQVIFYAAETKKATNDIAEKTRELKLAKEALQRAETQATNVAQNASTVIGDVVDMGAVSQEEALREKEKQVYELSNKATLLEQEIAAAREREKQAKESELKAKNELQIKKKSLMTKVKEKAGDAVGAVKKIFRREKEIKGSPSPDAEVVPSYAQSSTDSPVVYEPDYSTDATPPPAYY